MNIKMSVLQWTLHYSTCTGSAYKCCLLRGMQPYVSHVFPVRIKLPFEQTLA